MDNKELIRLAGEARRASYSPYSGYAVGAALLCEDGEVYLGCNIENAAFSPTNCAERTAFFKAVSEGKRNFAKIAIVGGKANEPDGFSPPCGVCRQVMAEFCNKNFEIILLHIGEIIVKTLSDILPLGFDSSMM